MRINLLLVSLLVLTFYACKKPSSSQNDSSIESWKEEIKQTERAFNTMAQEKGALEAFLFYADKEAVLARGEDLYKGINGIREFYSQKPKRQGESLNWKVLFVDVSKSGDLAYSYGKYIYTYMDADNNSQQEEGYYQTIWKKQDNGDWKYVWD